jgi:hypothetical protein
MRTGLSLVAQMMRKLGQGYDLHVHVPLEKPCYRGLWNCSAFVAWGLYQTGDRHYLGCRPYAPPGNHSKDRDTYTGLWVWTDWFFHDLERHARKVSERVALRTIGAIGMYRPHEKDGHPIGHIGISLGNGHVIEAHGNRHLSHGKAHYGPDPGVIGSRTMEGRFLHWYLLRNYSY